MNSTALLLGSLPQSPPGWLTISWCSIWCLERVGPTFLPNDLSVRETLPKVQGMAIRLMLTWWAPNWDHEGIKIILVLAADQQLLL